MNILFIKYLFVGYMFHKIPRVSVFSYFPLVLLNIYFEFNKYTYLLIYLYIYVLILVYLITYIKLY